MNIAAPDLSAPLGQPGQAWVSRVAAVLGALTLSGPTAQRPTKMLWTGRPYYDTSLAAGAGKPIWYNAASATKWRDATGADV